MKLIKTLTLCCGIFGLGSGLHAQTDPPVICRAFTETGQPIYEATLTLSAPAIPLNLTQTTDLTGTTSFASLPAGTNFGVGCYKNTNAANGVTVGDMIAISKHVLGIEELSSPYRMIAADANRSGSITTYDIVTIRNLILGVTPEFPNNLSWKFISADYVFANPHNPFQSTFPEPGSSSGFTAPVAEPIDFVGIKIGDVNNTASPDNFATFDERDLQTLFFETENKKVQAGEEFIATFVAGEAADGFQFTLHTGDLEILEVLPGTGTTAEQFAIFREKHAVTVACETPGTARFALRLKSTQAGILKDMLRIGGDITPEEAYLPATADREAMMADIDLRFSEMLADFQLFQNQPNPASDYTDIAFYLPADASATLTVFDNAGRVVFSKSGNYKKGDNKERVDLTTRAPGILYYQLQAGGFCAIRKMVRL